MYNTATYVTNSVLAQLESQESYEKVCQEKDSFVPDDSKSESVRSPGVGQEDSAVVCSYRDSASEASILDLNDVEYADASDGENSAIDVREVSGEDVADAMTPAEQEKLLSTRWQKNYIISMFMLLMF